MVGAAVADLLPAPDGGLAILDAGCGTGLCAPLLKPYATRLDGMDLSAGMLEKAAARGLYDRLDKAEITAGMEGRPLAYDLIACADTLCYFGDLAFVLTAAATALRPGGRLIFTVEALEAPDDATPDAPAFRLHPGHGRYAHTAAHVRAVADTVGLHVELMRKEELRKEGAMPVDGFLVACRRPAEA
nr:methyltransferase domain-containing protein [Xanthobacter oligotrophicus]